MSETSFPWKFKPLDDITPEEVHLLNKAMEGIQANDTDTLSPKLARHFVHEDTGERGIGTAIPVDPDEAYERAMKGLN
jgi:hypothetical protein